MMYSDEIINENLSSCIEFSPHADTLMKRDALYI